ncbi:NYN domain-containing protein [Nocardia alni]|uniref:NYN domain-containing protein n=1 Tax=Nocardia alni TaxID=2815723 RepID=UPI001C220384|nr:NYN domain-containing protein [Nocardia alni]
MSEVIVVDAANVVGSRPDGWWRDRAGAAQRLLADLVALQEHSSWTGRMVVVLEGAAKGAVPDRMVPGLEVVRAEGSGDDAIVAVVAASVESDAITVVTADRGLRARVEELGASVVGPRWLLDRMASARNS